MEMMLDKRQIRTIFLFELKMCCKAVDTICNISNTFGPRMANEYTEQGWLKPFCKGDKRLEDGEYRGQPSEVDNDS